MTKLRIATDCSGIEAPLEALRQLKIPYIQVFRSEIDKTAKYLSGLNYPKPEMEFEDLTKRNHSSLTGLNVDLYVCGFPCQSFSNAGKKLGTMDPRAKVVDHVIETIKWIRPKYFILENVKNLTQEYTVAWKVLNTKHYGLPQNRERVYIIGIRDDLNKSQFQFPKPVKLKKFISNFIDETLKTDKDIPNYLISNYEKAIIKTPLPRFHPLINSSGSLFSRVSSDGISPTITCSRGYIFHLRRYFSGKESLALQGFNPEKFKRKTISETKLCEKAGNSMSVCVLKKIIKNLIE